MFWRTNVAKPILPATHISPVRPRSIRLISREMLIVSLIQYNFNLFVDINTVNLLSVQKDRHSGKPILLKSVSLLKLR